MKNFLASQRNKWLLGIVFLAIGAGLTTKRVISYPEECKPEITAAILTLNDNKITKTS